MIFNSKNNSTNPWQITEWEDCSWDFVLRYQKKNFNEFFARNMEKVVKNNKIKNNTKYTKYYKVLKTSNWNPTKINLVSGDNFFNIVLANIAAAGYLIATPEIKNLSQEETIETLPDTLIELGFEKLTDEKFLTSEEYLQRGDILFGADGIIAVNLASNKKEEVKPLLPKKEVKIEKPVEKVEEKKPAPAPAPIVQDLSKPAQGSDKAFKGTWKATKNFALKSDADVRSSSLGAVPQGELVTSEGDYRLFGSQIWLKVNYKGHLGYCNLNCLTR